MIFKPSRNCSLLGFTKGLSMCRRSTANLLRECESCGVATILAMCVPCSRRDPDTLARILGVLHELAEVRAAFERCASPSPTHEQWLQESSFLRLYFADCEAAQRWAAENVPAEFCDLARAAAKYSNTMKTAFTRQAASP